MKKISFVIPCYRSEATLEKVIAEITVTMERLEKYEYEVVLVNGVKIDFRKNGEWRSIDCEREAVPAGLVPAEVARFVKANHPDNFVVDINREGIEMEVQLNNGLDMKFTRSGNFKYYDD